MLSPDQGDANISSWFNADMGLNLINFKRRNYQCGNRDRPGFEDKVQISVDVHADINA